MSLTGHNMRRRALEAARKKAVVKEVDSQRKEEEVPIAKLKKPECIAKAKELGLELKATKVGEMRIEIQKYLDGQKLEAEAEVEVNPDAVVEDDVDSEPGFDGEDEGVNPEVPAEEGVELSADPEDKLEEEGANA